MSQNPKFSVILPVYSEKKAKMGGYIHQRSKTAQRACMSVLRQQFTDFELIVVDDGCVDGVTPQILDKIAESDDRMKVIHKENQNRAIARNTGMDAATGEWICWLDSDDEYMSHYLRELDAATEDFPEYSIFNYGSILHWPDHHTSIRPVFQPPVVGDGHDWFKSGHIGTGSFTFKRELWASDPKYRIPDTESPYEFSALSDFDMRLPEDYPNVENPTGAFTDGKKRMGFSIGNPWGDDFLQFYKLTRDNHSKPLDVLLYVQYPRSHEERYRHFGEVYSEEV